MTGIELAQLVSQDVRADVRQASAQIGEALGIKEQFPDNQKRPALPD